MQHVRKYQRITVEPITGAIGAEISGVDLARLDDATFAEIRQAFADHLCVFFRDQQLRPADIEALGSRFGRLIGGSYVAHAPGSDYVQILAREAQHRWGEQNFGDHWHADLTFRESPNALAGLYSVETPSHGGDSMYASMYAAFDALSPTLQQLCEQLSVMHSASGLYGVDGTGSLNGYGKAVHRELAESMSPPELRARMTKETPHPLVVAHPVTGRKLLFISGPFAVRFDGMTVEESKPLIQYLYRHAQRPEFVVRWRWAPRQLGIWDNLACMHIGVQDYAGMRRQMYRFEVAGTRPTAANAQLQMRGQSRDSSPVDAN